MWRLRTESEKGHSLKKDLNPTKTEVVYGIIIMGAKEKVNEKNFSWKFVVKRQHFQILDAILLVLVYLDSFLVIWRNGKGPAAWAGLFSCLRSDKKAPSGSFFSHASSQIFMPGLDKSSECAYNANRGLAVWERKHTVKATPWRLFAQGGDLLTPLNLTDSHKHHQYQRKGCVNHAECFCANYENK